MIPWIQVYSNLTSHPKTARLAEELKLSSAFTSPNIVAAGLLVGVWTWAIQNAYNGDRSDCSATVIADACRWKKKPELLVAALKQAGFLDNDMKLHDWEEYAVMLIDAEDDRRAKTRDRVKRYRDKRCNSTCNVTEDKCNGYAGVTCNAGDTPCNAPTIPYITKHNITKNKLSGGGGDRAREEEPLDGMTEYHAAGDVLADVDELTQKLFSDLGSRKPTKADKERVFSYVSTAIPDLSGEWKRRIDESRVELLQHAFKLAAESGKAGDWKYIQGILNNFARRGIRSVEEADAYDAERDMEAGIHK